MILHLILNGARSLKFVGRSCRSSTDWMMNSRRVCKTLTLTQLNTLNDSAMNRVCTLLLYVVEFGLKELRKKDMIRAEVLVASYFDDLNIFTTKYYQY